MSENTYCTACGTRLSEGAKFCGGCGVSLAPKIEPLTVIKENQRFSQKTKWILLALFLVSLFGWTTWGLYLDATASASKANLDAAKKKDVLVRLQAVSSGDETENLGARDYLNAASESALPGVIGGLNALCSEFHFYTSEIPKSGKMIIFTVSDIDHIGVELVGENVATLEAKTARSLDGAYFTACGMLRKHAGE